MRLKIHNPCNQFTKYYRNYNLFWDELTIELNKKYEVIENRNFEDAHKDRFNVKFDSMIGDVGLNLMECEYVIENLDSGDFYVLSVADIMSQCMLYEKDNPKLKKVLISQFIDYEVKHHAKENYDKYSPWIYFPSPIKNLDEYYFERKKITSFIDKMCFWGVTSERPILKYFNKSIFDGPNYMGDQDKYFTNLIKYKVALSIAGVGELCYRDIECMAIGVPIIRFEYQTDLYEPLIPNYHYISVDYDKTIPKHNEIHTDRLGDERHSYQLEQRFNQVKDDLEFLTFIANNARKYYEENLTSPNRVINTLKILGL